MNYKKFLKRAFSMVSFLFIVISLQAGHLYAEPIEFKSKTGDISVYMILITEPKKCDDTQLKSKNTITNFETELAKCFANKSAIDIGRMHEQIEAKRSANANANDILLLRYFNDQGNPITDTDANLESLDITVDNTNTHSIALNKNLHYKMFEFLDIKEIADAQHGQYMTLKITYTNENGEKVNTSDLYMRRKNRIESYGWDFTQTDVIGLWIPVGMFATNFKATEDVGIEFSAMPVGIALGTKFWIAPSFYLGTSGIAMWAITNTETSNTTTGKNDKVYLGSFASGVLLDIGSWVYLSATYHLNFQKASGESHPGFMGGIGIGYGLIEAISQGDLPNFMK